MSTYIWHVVIGTVTVQSTVGFDSECAALNAMSKFIASFKVNDCYCKISGYISLE
jgi:hypothetical protein